MSDTRAAAFYCAYCGEEHLRPSDAAHGAWLCASCRRVFVVKLVGIEVTT